MRIKKIVISCFIILLPVKLYAQVDQDILKAAFIERITRFVEWPSGHLSDTSTVIVVGVINNQTYAEKIEAIFSNQKIKNRIVKVLSLKEGEDISHCQICYFDNISQGNIMLAGVQANKHGILLFSQGVNIKETGVHINFYTEKDNLKFEINERSVKSTGFKISHLLMKSARIL